jgi:hypothetical protein
MGNIYGIREAFDVPPPGAGVATATLPVPGKSTCDTRMVTLIEGLRKSFREFR